MTPKRKQRQMAPHKTIGEDYEESDFEGHRFGARGSHWLRDQPQWRLGQEWLSQGSQERRLPLPLKIDQAANLCGSAFQPAGMKAKN
jgi:hypothetical protein